MLHIEIETHDRLLGFDIAGVNDSLSVGTKVPLPGGGTIEFAGAMAYKAMGIPEVLQFIVDASTNIEYNLFAAWLVEKLVDKKVERVTINRRTVTEITAGGIRQVIEEEIRTY